MKPITTPNISIPTIGIPTIGIPSVGFPSASGGGSLSWPAGMKEHIKAWYDPKKQGLTNYDVIEAYVEDFTDWYKEINNGTVTATNKSFHFTEVKKIGSTNAIVRLVSHRINGEIKLNIKGVTEDNPISFTEYSAPVLTVNKDGVYTLVINDATVGIYFTKVGVVDVTVTQLPTSILKDLSGNGNHAYLYGGKGKLNSGMGVYQQDFSNVRGVTTVSANGFELFREGTGGTYLARISIGYWNNKECKLLFETNNTSNLYYIRYRKANNDVVTSVRLHNGENIIPAQDDLADVSEVVFEGILRDNEYIRVTEIPDYPDQLCYDGKMYAVCYGFPILTDYTVMAERTWFDTTSTDKTFISKRNTDNSVAAFLFEKVSGVSQQITSSFGANNNIEFIQGISYQTKNRYNGVAIKSGNATDNDTIVIGGSILNSHFSELWTGCHGTIIIADRSFTEEEINWLKQNWDKI